MSISDKASKKTCYKICHPLLSNKRQLRTTQEVTTGKHVIKQRVTEMTGPIITITSRSCYNCAGRNQCFPSTAGIILVTSYQECRSSCDSAAVVYLSQAANRRNTSPQTALGNLCTSDTPICVMLVLIPFPHSEFS